MAKSIRCKIKKRLRTAKRQRMEAMVYNPRDQEKYERLKRVIEGRSYSLSKPKNAFKYPEAEGAAFPQHQVDKPIDFRAQSLPMVGYVFRGNRRKYNKEEQEFLNNVAKTQHPKMEVLAGGGSVLAKTGARVSHEEAALIATAAERPDQAALAKAGPSSAASAVAAAVAEDEASEQEDADLEMEPENKADTSRRPVVKDTRRTKRVANARPRSNAVKKSNKVKV